MCALTWTDVFAAGACYFGIADLVPFASGDTHKFESRYEHMLVGPWPEAEATYRERSPINDVDRLATPMLVLQGTDDEVVPPSQAERIVDALRAREVPHAYLLFEGEGHGFRKRPRSWRRARRSCRSTRRSWGSTRRGTSPGSRSRA